MKGECALDADHGATDHLRGEVRRTWDTNAGYWDAHMGDGNDWHLELVRPAVVSLLQCVPGEHVLDLGCGNGLFARHLAQSATRVTACDISPEMVRLAAARGNAGGRITYRMADATDSAQLAAIEGAPFDAVVANMVLMDIPTVAPLADALPRMLAGPHGRFVFAVSHPCFHTTGTRMAMECDESAGLPQMVHSVHVHAYRSLGPARGVGIRGQPELQYYFDRTLQALLSPFFAAGFGLDGIREPTFAPPPADARPQLFTVYSEIPPVLVCRLRRIGV